ncbi:MAG: 3-keto-5-aminohexanoate cleavage protein [Hyphomicrobiaceae bacterium]
MSHKTVITCALTGGFDTADKSPAVPVSPEQIANSALGAAEAGAAVVHIHVRDPKTGKASMAQELYEETVERIRAKNKSLIINLTTGAGGRFIPGADDPQKPAAGTTLTTPAIRMRHIEKIKPEICTLDCGSLNFGPHVFINTPGHLADMAARAKAAGTKPEIEVFEMGHIELGKKLVADGLIPTPPLFQICLGISYGAPATPETMLAMRNNLPAGAIWSAFGIGRTQFPLVAQTVLFGGHVRVGLEDNLYISKGRLAASNAELVARAVEIIRLIGGDIASPAEARQIFQLGVPA